MCIRDRTRGAVTQHREEKYYGDDDDDNGGGGDGEDDDDRPSMEPGVIQETFMFITSVTPSLSVSM